MAHGSPSFFPQTPHSPILLLSMGLLLAQPPRNSRPLNIRLTFINKKVIPSAPRQMMNTGKNVPIIRMYDWRFKIRNGSYCIA